MARGGNLIEESEKRGDGGRMGEGSQKSSGEGKLMKRIQSSSTSEIQVMLYT